MIFNRPRPTREKNPALEAELNDLHEAYKKHVRPSRMRELFEDLREDLREYVRKVYPTYIRTISLGGI